MAAMLELLLLLFQKVTRRFQQISTYDELTDFGPVTPSIQDQLVMIYLTICAALAWLALGYTLALQWGKFGISVTLLGLLGIFAWFFLTPRRKEGRRICLLLVAVFLLGTSMYRMISYSHNKILDLTDDDDNSILTDSDDNTIDRLIDLISLVDPGDLAPVLFGIVLVFGSFTTIASFIKVRRWMYTMSVLLSAIVLLFWFRSCGIDPYQPYVIMGFSFFMGYVVAYSQEMVAQIRCGDDYYIQHAFALFIQMPAFIVHMITCRFKRRRRKDLSHWV